MHENKNGCFFLNTLYTTAAHHRTFLASSVELLTAALAAVFLSDDVAVTAGGLAATEADGGRPTRRPVDAALAGCLAAAIGCFAIAAAVGCFAVAAAVGCFAVAAAVGCFAVAAAVGCFAVAAAMGCFAVAAARGFSTAGAFSATGFAGAVLVRSFFGDTGTGASTLFAGAAVGYTQNPQLQYQLRCTQNGQVHHTCNHAVKGLMKFCQRNTD